MVRGSTGRGAGLAVVVALAVSGCVPGAMVSTVGTGEAGFGGDGGPAHVALLDSPGDLVATAAGVTFIVDGNCVVRRVDVLGVIRTIAGRAGTCGSSGDGGLATSATIDPFGAARRTDGALAVDGDGNVYVDDRGAGRIRRITPGGTISTVLAYGTAQAWIATDPQGRLVVNVYATVSNPYDGLYRRESNGSFTLLEANTPFLGLASAPDGSLYATTRFQAPFGVVSSVFRRLPSGDRVLIGSTVQGQPPITDLDVAADGTVYAVAGNHVLAIGVGGPVTTVAGTGDPQTEPGPRIGRAADLDLTPRALEIEPSGRVLVSSGHAVYRFWPPVV